MPARIGLDRRAYATNTPLMGYPLKLALRYLSSKKRAFISVGTAFAILGVALGVAALATVMSVTGGFQAQFREKVLGVNADVLVLKYSTDFREYHEVMDKVSKVPGVIGVGPFIINPMMVSHGEKTATGVLVKGIDPELMPHVLDLPKHIIRGSLVGLRRPGAAPPPRRVGSGLDPLPSLVSPPDSASPPSKPASPDSGADLPTPPAAGSAPDEHGAGSTGEVERDDAGRNLTLLRAVEASIRKAEEEEARAKEQLAREMEGTSGRGERAEREQQEREHAGSRGDGPEDAGASAMVLPALDRGAPRGSVVPDGGYKSQLPDEDVLPDDVAPDRCANPEEVAKMPGIAVGVTLARNLGVDIGDCVDVTSPTIGFTFGQGSLRPPVAKQFRVIAVFEAGFDQYDSKLVYTDLYEAQGFYDQGDTVNGVEMKVADVNNARAISRTIDKMLANGLYHTMDWEELNHGLFTALTLQKIMMSIVMALIIVVAAFTVVATLVMVVLDKKREIAVLKAMGATNEAILRAFIYQGGIIGTIGTLVGLSIGLLLCKGLLIYGFPLDPKVYFISRLPVQVQPLEFTFIGLGAMTICVLATIPPALYAALLRPAEGLRAQ